METQKHGNAKAQRNAKRKSTKKLKSAEKLKIIKKCKSAEKRTGHGVATNNQTQKRRRMTWQNLLM